MAGEAEGPISSCRQSRLSIGSGWLRARRNMATEDEAAVRAVMKAFVDSWNRHDMRLLSALFSEDADFVDVFGNGFEDRTAIEQALTQRHATVLQKSRFTAKQVAVRFHKPDLPIAHAVIELIGQSNRQRQHLPPSMRV